MPASRQSNHSLNYSDTAQPHRRPQGKVSLFAHNTLREMATFTGQQEQQWDNVVFRKAGMKRPGQSKNQHLNSQRRAGNVVATKKMGRSNNSAVRASDRVGGEANMCKLEADNESLKHAKVTHELRKAISQART